MVKYMGKKADNMRYERKFNVRHETFYSIEQIVKLHPAGFTEIFPERRVNNIYFDSYNYQAFNDNIAGISKRVKLRVRWYGDFFGLVKKPVLEYKLKNNLAGSKRHYPLSEFNFDKNFSFDELKKVLKSTNHPESVINTFCSLNPTLLNSYTRKYYLSADTNYRLTLDRNLHYYKIDNHSNLFLKHVKDRENTVIELKYHWKLDDEAQRISHWLKFRMTKKSKYVTGILNLFVS